MNIAIVTIAYNHYGKFLEGWLKSVYKQTILPAQIVIVLSGEHGFTKKKILKEGREKGIEIKIVKEEKGSMGKLRNVAIENTNTDWVLYFSADDELLENAVEEISRARASMKNGDLIIVEHDAVSLTYLQETYGEKVFVETPIPKRQEMIDWRGSYRNGGYVAFKKKAWEDVGHYDDNDFPNFPFMFKMWKHKKTYGRTENPCALYIKRQKSHSTGRNTGQTEEAYKTIDEAVKKYVL